MSGDAAAAQPAGSAKTPADFLKSIRGRPVVVKLNSGVDYRGMHWLVFAGVAFVCV
jgi:U6 snRNA-associated Sm-like protein LSm6